MWERKYGRIKSGKKEARIINQEKKNKHMTLDDRIEIQECLSKGMIFKAIGKRIGKDQTTVSKETNY